MGCFSRGNPKLLFTDLPGTGPIGFRECHVKPDWLLIYRIDEGELMLFLSSNRDAIADQEIDDQLADERDAKVDKMFRLSAAQLRQDQEQHKAYNEKVHVG